MRCLAKGKIMLINFKKAIIKILFVILIIFPNLAISSDFEDGLKAYNNKEYFKALSFWKTLVEQGNLKAEYYIGIVGNLR